MTKFAYTAVNKAGKQITGTSEAVSRQALGDTLAKQGLRPVSIKVVNEASGLSAKFKKFGKKVKMKDLVIFWTGTLGGRAIARRPLEKAVHS